MGVLFRDFPFTNKVSDNFQNAISERLETIELEKGSLVVSQYEVGEFFYFLLDGKVEFSIKIAEEKEELKVGETSKPFTPIGWSGFREPYRYATTVSCVENCRLLRGSVNQLRELIVSDPASGQMFLQFVVFQSQRLLKKTKHLLTQFTYASNRSFLNLDKYTEISKGAKHKGIDILKRSPFFEVFSSDKLQAFAKLGTEKHYIRGEKVYYQEKPSTGFDVLIGGKVALIYESSKEGKKQDMRIIQNDGYIIGSGLFTNDGLNDVTCIALSNSTILHIDGCQLSQYLSQDPSIGVSFYLRLLWFISNRLRSARAKLITVKYDGEILAVRNLIEQNCTQLSVISSLHKVPHLLSHTYTLSDGIDALNLIKESGTTLERSIANSSLEILSGVFKEHQFYQGLSTLYHEVVNAPKELSHFEVRKLCAERFTTVFENTDYKVIGEDNLPDEPSVFIYNHLENHVFNTMPNNFQLTLDSHFISSNILYKKYGNPGIRVVRVPKSDEYGHQYYYERLGHIPVYTQDSAAIKETPDEKKKRREEFYNMASGYLESGTSIMLAPEGQSVATGASPTSFKPGAFRLPTFMKKEPYIVPIVMANFDKRVGQTTFVAMIKEPFKISNRVKDPNNKEEMINFLDDYQKEYKAYVKEAIELSQSKDWMELID